MINSILNNNNLHAKDNEEPFSFIEWLKHSTSTISDINQQFTNYKNYIISWTEKKSFDKKDLEKTLQASYVQVLREIVISYSTEEERRFINNVDFNNASDVEIILPFFINKLKQICLFYTTARENIKYTPIEYAMRGTSAGIKKLVKDLIFTTAQLDISFDSEPCFFPPISAIAKDLDVYVEELYDETDNYFNQPASSTSTTLQNTSSTNLIFSNLYIDLKQAFIDAINQYPFYISSLRNLFSINPSLCGTEYGYLKERDFINYFNDGVSDSLKLNLLKKLAPKYLANNFFYLSTGNTSTNLVSGLLFTVAPLTGAPTLNFLNRHAPTVATVPNLNDLYADYELGRFFLPQYHGILIHSVPNKKYVIDTTKLQANKIYVFPDPDIIGNVSYNSGIEHNELPLTYTIDVTHTKVSRGNQYKFGDILATSYDALYYGYQSREQDLNLNATGVCRVQVNLDFWTGDKKNIWKNRDLWPGIDTVDEYPLLARQESLLVNRGTPLYWGNDLFGNDYCVVKEIDNLKTTDIVLDEGVIPGYNTVPEQNTSNIEESSIFEKKYDIYGTLFVRDAFTNIVTVGSLALSSVFARYPRPIQQEIIDGVRYFAMYGNTFVLETNKTVIIDTINYIYNKNQLTPQLPYGLLLSKFNLSEKLERFAGEWYSEEENILYVCMLEVDPGGYKSSFRSLYPKIYSINVDTLKWRLVYPNFSEQFRSIYSLSSVNSEPPNLNIFKLEGISFEFLQKNNTFNLAYLGKNLNGLPLIVNEQLYKVEPFLKTYQPQLFQPFLFNVDTNYYTSTLSYLTRHVGSTTGIIGTHTYREGRFATSTFTSSGVNYMFCDGVKPLQINEPGRYVVQFDWESYTDVTVFIGCSAFNVRNTDYFLFWDADTSRTSKLEVKQTYSIVYEKTSAIRFNVEITRLQKDPSLVQIDVFSINESAGPLCISTENIYKLISIKKSGEGEGVVVSDPFCIDCNSKCSEFFGYNTTITLIASADYWSVFDRWIEGPCSDTNTDCIFTVTSAYNIIAKFNKIPTFEIKVTTPAGKVFTQDLRLIVDAGNGEDGEKTRAVVYPAYRLVTLSAVTPISGWVMYGYDGGACNGVISDRCTFFASQPMKIYANYIRYYEYPLTIAVTSYVQAQSSVYNSIDIGLDNVLNGIRTRTPVYFYNCNSSCVFMTTGTNTSLYKNQIASLSANPGPGRRLKFWIGDLDCNQEEYTTKKLSTDPTDVVNRGFICNLEMDRPRSVGGVFDIGYYTLTIINSGDGRGEVFNVPRRPFDGLSNEDPMFRDTLEGKSSVKYAVLSGTTLTVYCTALRGNTFLTLSSEFCPEAIDGVSACPGINMYKDITVIATFSAIDFYPLEIINLATCGVTITAFPPGRFNIRIDCPAGGVCSTSYPQDKVVDIGPTNETYVYVASANAMFPVCDIWYFDADEGSKLEFDYQNLDGSLLLPKANKRWKLKDRFSLVDGSIILTPGGAPYASGTGIIVSPNAYAIMSTNLTVTAVPI